MAPRVQILLADGIRGENSPEDSLTWKLAGDFKDVTSAGAQQVMVTGIATHLKIKFIEKPAKSQLNPAGQVGLQLFQVMGTPMSYFTGSQSFDYQT